MPTPTTCCPGAGPLPGPRCWPGLHREADGARSPGGEGRRSYRRRNPTGSLHRLQLLHLVIAAIGHPLHPRQSRDGTRHRDRNPLPLPLERAGAGVRSIAPRAHLSARALRAPGPSHATSHSGAANARQGYSEKPALDLGGWCESTRGGSPHRQSDACGAQASRNRRFAPAWGTARPIAGTDPSVRAPGDTGEIRASGLLRRGWWLRASRRHSPRPKRGTR